MHDSDGIFKEAIDKFIEKCDREKEKILQRDWKPLKIKANVKGLEEMEYF